MITVQYNSVFCLWTALTIAIVWQQLYRDPYANLDPSWTIQRGLCQKKLPESTWEEPDWFNNDPNKTVAVLNKISCPKALL